MTIEEELRIHRELNLLLFERDMRDVARRALANQGRHLIDSRNNGATPFVYVLTAKAFLVYR